MKTSTNQVVCPVVKSQTEKTEEKNQALDLNAEVRVVQVAPNLPENSPYVKDGKVIAIPFHSWTVAK